MRKLGFWTVCCLWLILVTVVYIVNGLTVRSALLQRCAMAALGAYLLVWPVWPKAFGVYYDEKTCGRMIRVCGAVEVLSSFLVRPFF